MNRKSADRRLNLLLPLLLTGGLALGLPLQLAAQVPVDEYGEPLEALDPFDYVEPDGLALQPLDSAELEELVGPIALYPDDLLAIVLPASAYPLQIVQAARFLDELATDSSLEPDESWDESVIALLNYPEVLYMMDKEIDWTWRLGEAVINQQPEVLSAVESFRDRAYAAGNLESDERQTVSHEDGVIEITPVDEEIIYVPYYEPQEVVVYQPRRVYHYYPYAYPVYYYPYPVGYSFSSGYFWGVTTAFTIGWSNRYVHVYHPSYWGHPYYGRYYYGHYYRRPSITVYNNWYVHNSYRSETHRHRNGDYWRPRNRSGARPEPKTVRNRHYRPNGRDDDRSVDRQAYLDRRSAISSKHNEIESRANRTANRARTSTSADRQRPAVANRNTNRRDRVTSNDFRFRERPDSDRSRTSVDRVRERNSAARRDRNTTSSGSPQRLVARNPQQHTATNTRVSNHQASRRSLPDRSTSASRASSRITAGQRQSAQRQVAQRQVTQRPASQPSVQRPAPAQRQASRPTTQRQSASSRPATSGKRTSGKRGGSHNRKKRN